MSAALLEARESLGYWEDRLSRLPRRAVRQRREAREMVARWRARVCEAERAEYGAGMLGAALMLLAERRLPTDARAASRRVARIAARTTLAAFAVAVAAVALAAVLLAQLIL